MHKIEIDMVKLGALCQRRFALEECASFFECSADTVERRVKEAFEITFKEFRERQMSKTKFKLIDKALDMAHKGSVPMMIFCLKNICAWKDRVEEVDENQKTIVVNFPYALEEKKKETNSENEVVETTFKPT